jgi:hypothetical protein
MNVFNRFFMTLLCLVLIGLGIAVLALTWAIPTETIDWLRDATDWMGRHNQDTEKALLSLIAGVVAFLGLVLLLLELLPDEAAVRVTDLKVGGAVLSTADVQQRIEEAVRTVDHVVNVKATVKAKRRGVTVLLNLDVDPDANLALVTDEACGTATDVLANKVHVALAEPPQARLHYRELRFKTRTVKDADKDPDTMPVVIPEDEDPKEALMRIAAAPPPEVPVPEPVETSAENSTIATAPDEPVVAATGSSFDAEPVPLTVEAASNATDATESTEPTKERPDEKTPST